ncbi:MAG TPA: cytochrome P450 [Thermomicrobiales bacterium]|nr:cytochrome P450 [Thermomicrobiales bacterium]
MGREQAVGGIPFTHDPYPQYAAWRADDAILYDRAWNGWTITGYNAVAAVLRDSRFGADRSEIFFGHLDMERRAALHYLARVQRAMMLFADPPRHTRLRGLVNRAFTPRVVASIRDTIQMVIDDLLDTIADRGQMDVIGDLAYPLPTMVIARLLGVPPEDRTRLKAWSDDFAVFIGGGAALPGVPERADASVRELSAYLQKIVAERRRAPGMDLISGLLTAEERGDVLDEDELYATCMLVLIAGHETTTNLIGNGLLALLIHPGERARLQDDWALLPSAIDELLRYDSPVQVTSRIVCESFRWDGHSFEAGQFVDLWLGAANRDPARFPDPDRLDLSRTDNRHLAFGYGAHFCIGAPLARLEGELAIGTVLRRFPDLKLDPTAFPLLHHDSSVFRALQALPVRF